MTQHFKVVFKVEVGQLPVLLEVVSKQQGISLLTVENMPLASDVQQNITVKVRRPGPTPRYLNGVKNKGITAKALIMSLVESGPVSYRVIAEKFAEQGFAGNSLDASLSHARLSKIVIRDDATGIYRKAINDQTDR